MTGKITRVVVDKRFGFIQGTDKKDYFFHESGFDQAHGPVRFSDLQIGETVSFEPRSTEKGMRAESIRRME